MQRGLALAGEPIGICQDFNDARMDLTGVAQDELKT